MFSEYLLPKSNPYDKGLFDGLPGYFYKILKKALLGIGSEKGAPI